MRKKATVLLLERKKMASEITKLAICEALKRILEHKALDNITIKDITDECGINRMTFYYHFRDIYDLVEWILSYDSEKTLKGLDNYQDWTEGFIKIFRDLEKEKLLVKNVYHSFSPDQIRRFIVPLADKLLMRVVNELSRAMVIREDDKIFIAHIYSYTLVGLVLDWIMDGMESDPVSLVERFQRVIQGDVLLALNRFRKDNTSK